MRGQFTSAPPEGAWPHHVVVGGRHSRHVAPVAADFKVKLVAVLLHPDVGLGVVLGVDQLVPVVSVDRAPEQERILTEVYALEMLS